MQVLYLINSEALTAIATTMNYYHKRLSIPSLFLITIAKTLIIKVRFIKKIYSAFQITLTTLNKFCMLESCQINRYVHLVS